jgi:hypothetical protein
MHETTFDNFDTENKINNLMFFHSKKKKKNIKTHMYPFTWKKRNEMKWIK